MFSIFKQLCCAACKVGWQIALTSGKCNQKVKDSLTDDIRIDCCNRMQNNFSDEHEPEEIRQVDFDENTSDDTLLDSYPCEKGHHCPQLCFIQGDRSHCECREGYEKNNSEGCDDIDECELNEHNCKSYEKCVNLPGYFRCDEKTCKAGYVLNLQTRDCDDINECELNEHYCKSGDKCINLQGSFRCERKQCSAGYAFNIETRDCDDVNECELNQHNCKPIEKCTNLKGSFRCDRKICSAGYILNTQTGDCEDVNECQLKPCPLYSVCINTPGSFRCDCDYGYRYEKKSRRCRDIDECVEHPLLCDHQCFNRWGTYQCGCNRGYELQHDNRTCKDIDECQTNGKVLCQGTCKNTIGSFRCGCQKGLTLDHGRFCKGKKLLFYFKSRWSFFSTADINECEENPQICGGKHEFCLNTWGSYQCMKKKCDYGYRLIGG